MASLVFVAGTSRDMTSVVDKLMKSELNPKIPVLSKACLSGALLTSRVGSLMSWSKVHWIQLALIVAAVVETGILEMHNCDC